MTHERSYWGANLLVLAVIVGAWLIVGGLAVAAAWWLSW